MASQESSKSKKKQAKLVRNVLAQPFKQHWPAINDAQLQELSPILKSTLSPIKIDRSKPSWKLLRKLKKEDRKQKMTEYINSQPEKTLQNRQTALKLRQNIFIGINAVMRGAENKCVEYALVAEEVKPKMIVRPLIQILYSLNIPILLIPDMKKITKDIMGYSCIALGFKKSDEFVNLKSTVLSLFNNLEVTEIDDECDNDNNNQDEKSPEDQSRKSESEPLAKIRKIDECSLLDSIYVYKDKPGYQRKSFPKMDNSDNEITLGNIKLGQKTGVEPSNFSKNARYYLPPVVNKLQSNPLKRRKIKTK